MYYWLRRRVHCLASFGPVFLIVAGVVGGGRHIWMCRDGGRGNGHGGGRLSSLCYFVKNIISQGKKKKKKRRKHTGRERQMHLRASPFIVNFPRWCWGCV